MIKHTIKAVLSAQDLTEIDAALTTLETKLGFTVGLESYERLGLHGMGPQNKAFADQALEGALLNQGLIPDALKVEAIHADKTLCEQLLPPFERIRAMDSRLDDTIFLLGSEYYAGARAIYRALKAFGSMAGIEDLLAELKLRFRKAKSSKESSGGAES